MNYREFSINSRRLILEQAKRAHVGHIGSALSIVDILSVLYNGVMNVQPADSAQRDRFVLSKGHAALALYAALHLKSIISKHELNTYCADGTLLGVHPEHQVSGIDFTTGSLGQGLSFAAGAALAGRLDESPRRVYTLLSDAECNEGSVWEAGMFAAHHRLDKLTAIVDLNGQQALGRTKDILDQETLGERWNALGWHVEHVDGHNAAHLEAAFLTAQKKTNQPSILIARTVAGKGVSYMEGLVEWHYRPMDDDQYKNALSQIDEST